MHVHAEHESNRVLSVDIFEIRAEADLLAGAEAGYGRRVSSPPLWAKYLLQLEALKQGRRGIEAAPREAKRG